MATADSSFSAWLLTKLNAMKVDESIFLNYIMSIVEGEETRDEKFETLQSVLIETDSSEEEINNHCTEILDTYQLELAKAKQVKVQKSMENVDQKLARLLELNVQVEETAHQACKYTEEELRIRQAILSKYSHANDPEDDELEDEKPDAMDDLEKNTNALVIHQAEKEKRENARLENQKKKERDKMERDKQKVTQQEKKEARRKRAQKVEHNRK